MRNKILILKYRFVYWIARILNCREIIDGDAYYDTIPPRKVKYVELPSFLLKFNDEDYRKFLSKYPLGRPDYTIYMESMQKAETSLFKWYEQSNDKEINK